MKIKFQKVGGKCWEDLKQDMVEYFGGEGE